MNFNNVKNFQNDKDHKDEELQNDVKNEIKELQNDVKNLQINKIEMINFKDINFDVSYSKVFNQEDCTRYFNELNSIEYLPKSETEVYIYGKKMAISREQIAFANDGINYTFSGKTLKSKPWIPVVLEIKNKVENILGIEFNFCLVNKYKNGFDNIGKHRDDEKQLVPNSPIAGVSFGITRQMVFNYGSNEISVNLENGSLISINSPTNKFWTHSIPRNLSIKEPRISLTFRKFLTS